MGQQQLLLLVVGIIIVAVAVVVGIQIFDSAASQSVIDGIMSVHSQIQMDAQAYFYKPKIAGGGGISFVDFNFPPDLVIVNGHTVQSNGNYAIATNFFTRYDNDAYMVTTKGLYNSGTKKIEWVTKIYPFGAFW